MTAVGWLKRRWREMSVIAVVALVAAGAVAFALDGDSGTDQLSANAPQGTTTVPPSPGRTVPPRPGATVPVTTPAAAAPTAVAPATPVPSVPTTLPSTGVTTPSVVVTSDKVDRPGVYVVKPDGTGLRRLVDDPGQAAGSSWSPDGKRLLFTTVEYPVQSRFDAGLWSVDVVGGGMRQLVAGQDVTGRWSPDGSRLGIQRGGDNGGLQVAKADGTDPVWVARGRVYYWAWSPDGTRIAYRKEADVGQPLDLVVVGADGKGATTVASGPDIGEAVDWSPDGRWLLFPSTNQSSDVSGDSITLVRPDGTDRHIVPGHPPVSAPYFTPKGRICFIGGDQQWVMDVDGSRLRQVSKRMGVWAWAPDESAFAQTSPDAKGGVDVADADTGVVHRIVAPVSGLLIGVDRWSPKTGLIAFTVGTDRSGSS